MVLGVVRRPLIPLAVALLRISTGVIMAVHGWLKLKNIPGTVEQFTNIGIPNPDLAVYGAIAGEFFGGLGLILGFLTPLAALGVAFTMAVAVFNVHWDRGVLGLLAANNGYEYPMTIFWVAVFFVIHGAGPISIDRLFCRKKPEVSPPSPAGG